VWRTHARAVREGRPSDVTRAGTNDKRFFLSFFRFKRLRLSRYFFFSPSPPPRVAVPFVYRASATSSRTRSSTFAFAHAQASGVYGGGTTQHPITVSVAAR
jgi:hypothetical protein